LQRLWSYDRFRFEIMDRMPNQKESYVRDVGLKLFAVKVSTLI